MGQRFDLALVTQINYSRSCDASVWLLVRDLLRLVIVVTILYALRVVEMKKDPPGGDT